MDLTIGVIAPLDGGEAVVAVPMLAAVRAAVRAYGPCFGGQVAVRALDDGRDPERAVACLERLLDDTEVLGIIGPKNSGSALAVRELAVRSGLPLLLPAATADALSGPGPLLRLCATDADTAAAAIEVARTLGTTALFVEPDDTDYGRNLATAVSTAAMTVGLPLVDHLGAADAAFLAMGEVEQAVRITEVRSLGFTGHLLGAEGGPDAPLARLAGAAAEGSWQLYAGAFVPASPRVYTAEATAGTQALLSAYEATLHRARIAPWLRSEDRPVVDSILGPLRFGPDGQRIGAAVSVWRISGGTTHLVGEVTATGTP